MVVPQLISSSYRVVFFHSGLTGLISFIVLLEDVCLLRWSYRELVCHSGSL